MKSKSSVVFAAIVGGVFSSYNLNAQAILRDRRPESLQDIKFGGESIMFGLPGWNLPATFIHPSSTARIAVFVHGSGPLDRDSTVQDKKLFGDLSEALAKEGIGSFRYEKRSRFYALRYLHKRDVSLQEETIVDAIEAITYIRERYGNRACITLLGHSLGGFLAPEIAAYPYKGGGPNALVLLAVPGRNVIDTILEQLEGRRERHENAFVEKRLTEEVERLKSYKETAYNEASSVGQLPSIFSPSAWRFLASYNYFGSWQNLRIPTLALFGEVDQQISAADESGWRNNQTMYPSLLKVYRIPDADHFFYTSGKSSKPSLSIEASRLITAHINGTCKVGKDER